VVYSYEDVYDTEGNPSDEPLIQESAFYGGAEEFIYDEDGSLALGQPSQPLLPARPILPVMRPCSLATLNGSWLLTLTPASPHLPHFATLIRGPMRIEVQSPRLRISGDMYVRSLITPPADAVSQFDPSWLVIRKNWYPAFPQSEYRWYFRSTGVKYSNGKLLFKFERHLWSGSSQDFVSKDNGWMEFDCHVSQVRPIGFPQATIEMKGTAMVGGTQYDVAATKTSPYYRGCLVEVDVMTSRQWPASATACGGGQTFSFTSVYRATGMDFRVQINEINVPDDPLLTNAELHKLLTTHRSLSAGGENWSLWLLVGSRSDGALGIMFDTDNPPHREGAIGFYDPTLSNISTIQESARGKKLGEVPLAFLRTLIHEAGHVFNLFHPKHDVHGVPIGTTIMNQTGDVMGFATVANPYPCNATMDFDDHNRTSLIHASDPQVKPGWKEFGWGHGTASSGIAEPVDAIGFDEGGPFAEGLQLRVELSSEAIRGEIVFGTVIVTNIGNEPRNLTTALNLAEGDLRMTVTTPNGQNVDVRDVVLVCGERRMTTLQPGESFSDTMQLFYGPHGFTFEQPGHYKINMELSVGDGTVLESEPVTIAIHPATTDSEHDLERLTMDQGVGLSLALGDFGLDIQVRDKLLAVMERFGSSDTGAACAMVLANSFGRDLRDILSTRVLRPKDEGEASRVLDLALQGRDATTCARLSTAVVSPRETAVPLLDMVQERINRARRGAYTSEDRERATKLISDHLA
jgi:hypothetical protein